MRREQIGAATLYLGDCMDVLPAIKEVDAVIADLPYGTTQNKWDSVLPLDALWPLYWQAAKHNAAIVLNSAQPFTSMLVMSQVGAFKYNWIWQKDRPTGHLSAKKQPMREHEEICVFYRSQPTYNPQFTIGQPNNVSDKPRIVPHSENYGRQSRPIIEHRHNQKYPKTILKFGKPAPCHVVHPTQKPVDLMAYMIRTYTVAGETVLDNVMGSGTTGVAAIQEGRSFIGIESDPTFFEIACRRIEEATNA